MKPKDNPNIYGTPAWQAQKLHDQRQAKADATYKFKPNPPAPPQANYNSFANSSAQTNSRGAHRERSRTSPKSAITIVGLIVGAIGAAYAATHGVTSTFGLACAFGFSAAPVVLLLQKLTKS